MRPSVATPLLALALTGLCLPACQLHPTVLVKAQYVRLEGHTAAVLVATPDQVLDADAANDIGQAVARRLADNVKGVKMLPYGKSRAFMEANPYWTTRAPSAAQKALGVERLIVVDVSDFQTHEEGSRGELMQGLAGGHVRVLEAESVDADRFAFSQTASSNYPPLNKYPLGVPEGFNNAGQPDVRFNLIQVFSRDAAGLFYDHKETR